MKIVLVTCLLAILTGCSALRPSMEAKAMVDNSYVAALLADYVTNKGLEAKRQAYAAATDEVTKRDIRDKAANELMTISNALYKEFRASVFQDKALRNNIVDIVNLALTGTAAVTGALRAKSNMAAFSTFLTGSNSAIDKNDFADKTVIALIQEMDAERTTVLTRIVTGLQQNTATYGFEVAYKDLAEYHDAGSLITAIIALSSASGAKNDAAKASFTTQMRTLRIQ